ncbi:MAG: translocation/assembly module TamB domain-containing protein [Cyanomargarita calcarea GSE-NOS-MK-12-04C]|jgi:translocation and assembly module TamB|uniref:Translocation/assembly module TamB domain-containing protein n=1 Tax=Cyanomargarita calcarea GSE-NOS-MK-12-04C TaxID=2839659 RepID=A0A951QQP7_9CYAN|nr:translocation/assembly module TamB domain-containing protein [Cyanomargarita calcarea GSE-NOS-MK-12-04C]
MTQSPPSGHEPEPSNRRFWLLLLGRTSLALGGILAIGIAAGSWWAWKFVQNDLAPLVETNLKQLLGRPVELGKVEGFSFNSLKFGSLSVPATANDPDKLAAQAVQVEFSPWRLLFNRTLELNVVLIRPSVYIEQDKSDRWVSTEIKTGEENAGLVKTDLQGIRLENADIVLVPNPKPGTPRSLVGLDAVNGLARFLPQKQGVSYELSGQPTTGGEVKITGVTQTATQQTNLNIQAQNFLASDLTRLVKVPLTLQAGRVNSNLMVQLQQNQPKISLTGTAAVAGVTAQVDNVPQKLTNIIGRLNFQGQKVAIENLSTSYGKIPVQLTGAVDTQAGYNVSAQVKPVSVKNLLDTLKFKAPVPATGEVRGDFQVQGLIREPIVTGTASTTKPTQIDRVQFKAISSKFKANISQTASSITVSNFQATPTVGGEIAGSGQVKVGRVAGVSLDVQAQGVPASALARAYGIVTPIDLGNVSANAKILGSGNQPLEMALDKIQVNPTAGGQITASGQVQLASQGRVSLDVQAQGLPANTLAQAYNVSLPINIGGVSAKAKVSGSLGKQPLEIAFSNIQANPEIGGQISASGQVQLASQGKVSLDVQAQGLPANALAKAYNVSVPINIGGVSAKAKVSGSLGKQPLEIAFSNIQANPQVGGQITARGQVQLASQGRVSINVQANNLPGDAMPLATFGIAKAYNTSPSITIGNVSANANISGSLKNLQAIAQLQAPKATYPVTGQVTISKGQNLQFQDAVLKFAGGTVRGRGQLVENRWQAFVDAEQIQLSRFQQIPPQFRGLLSSKLNLSGTTASFQPPDIQATGQASLNVAGGTVNLRDINLNAGRWQATANISQVQVNRFNQQLQGRFNSNLRLAGTTSFQLADIRAIGQASLSQVPLLNQPLNAQFQWNGQQIIVQRATTPGLSANGIVAVQLPPTGTPQIADFNFNVQARGYNLKNTPFKLPANLALAGLVDFSGKVIGTPTTPTASGDIRLRNLAVNNLAFDPVLNGSLNFQGGQGGQLQLAGTQDRIAVNLNADNRPTSFLVQRAEAVATGKSEGNNLLVNVKDFPVAVLENLVPNNSLNLKPIAGKISGNLAVNLTDFATVGDVAIAQPRIGRVAASQFQGRLSYAKGAASLTNGELRLGDSLISLSGNVQAGNNPQFQLQANLNQTKIQNVLQAFSIFDFQDFSTGLKPPKLGTASALQTQPVSLVSADLLTQLQQFSKFADSVAQQRTQQEVASSTSVPTLAELEGALNGQLTVAGSLKSGVNANFNFGGSNLKWGNYNINEVVAQGNFADGTLTLQPLRVGLNDGLLAFAGQVGSEELSGQLQVNSLPVEILQPFLEKLPVAVTGKLNANTTVAGSLKNPRAIGEVTLADATLNKQPVQTGELNFGYNNARLNFASNLLLTGTEPVKITGSIPAELPFTSVKPDSNQITINANVQNEGLALLNVLNNQVNWVDGQGQVNVAIQGTLKEPIITGNVNVNNATLKAQALSEPLTNVTGTLQFNGDRVVVEGIQGQYSRGNLTAAGILPIFASQQAQQEAATNPLTVSLNDLALNVEGLYQGGVSGNVAITGTALKPTIGGAIRLKNGEVSLAQEAANTTPKAATTPEFFNLPSQTTETTTIPQPVESPTTSPTARPPIEFAGLQLILDDNVRVTRQPLLSFVAKGDLTINGTLADPRPQGIIRLTGGQVNLFTTQFTLARGYEQTAEFTPSQKLDPTLDVRLVAIVPEAAGTRAPTTPISSEIADVPTSSLGTLRTVRVQATATGLASQLSDNLELTSEPRRSEGEIVALLGGSIINTFTQQDATLGIASIAGSTLLGGLQGTITSIGEAIGFSEFRLSPTIITNQKSNASVLGLSAEGVFNIGNDFSVSLSQVFAADQPLRYNVLYRLNDDILVRGSTSFSDDSRAVVEYEKRF